MTDVNEGDTDGWQRVVKHCTDVMAKRGLKLRPIDPDGKCLFRAVGCALDRESEYGDLRQQCIAYMKAHRDDFAPFISDEDEGFSALHPNTNDVDLFDHRLKRMAEDGCWGAHPELTALAQLLKTNVLVEEKFGEQNFRVLSEMRILAKIKLVIFDFGRASRFCSEIWREIVF